MKTTQDLFITATREYIEQARSEMRRLLINGQKSVSVDDVYRVYPPHEFINTSKAMRHIFMHPDFKRVGTRQSKRISAQRRYIGFYVLSDSCYITSLADVMEDE